MLNPVVVFQKVGTQTQTARIDFENGPTRHQLYLSKGHLVYAKSSDPYFSLVSYLVRKHRIDADAQRRILALALDESKSAEQVIEGQELLPRKEIASRVASLTREILYDLFSWDEGEYSVTDGKKPPAGALWVKFPLSTILEKGRQIHEKWQRLSGKVPKLEAVLRRAGQPDQIELSPEEWKVLSAVDGNRTVYEVCEQLSANRLQILSRLALLLDKQLVDIADYREQSRTGGLGGSGLTFQTVSQVYRNLFAILIERLEPADPGAGCRALNQATMELENPPPALLETLEFQPRPVFDEQGVLKTLALTGNSIVLKDLLLCFSALLKSILTQIGHRDSELLQEVISDVRGVLVVAEEVLPSFHLSLHTAVEKALMLENRAFSMNMHDSSGASTASSAEEMVFSGRAMTEAYDSEVPPSGIATELAPDELEELLQSDSQLVAVKEEPQPKDHGYHEAKTLPILPDDQEGPADGSRDPPSRAPEERSRPEPPATGASAVSPVEAQGDGEPILPVVDKDQSIGRGTVTPESLTEGLEAVPQLQGAAGTDSSSGSPVEAGSAEEAPPVLARNGEDQRASEVPNQRRLQARKEQRDLSDEISDPLLLDEETGSKRKLLIGVLLTMVVILATLLAASGYVLYTNKGLRLRIQRTLRRLVIMTDNSVGPKRGHGLNTDWEELANRVGDAEFSSFHGFPSRARWLVNHAGDEVRTVDEPCFHGGGKPLYDPERNYYVS